MEFLTGSCDLLVLFEGIFNLNVLILKMELNLFLLLAVLIWTQISKINTLSFELSFGLGLNNLDNQTNKLNSACITLGLFSSNFLICSRVWCQVVIFHQTTISCVIFSWFGPFKTKISEKHYKVKTLSGFLAILTFKI